MENLLFGILTVILCIAGYYFSRRYFRINRTAIALTLLMLCGLLLRVYAASDMYLHPWDERFHALVAKNFIKHPLTPALYDNPVLQTDYRNWGSANIWVHKQPMPLWTMAVSIWLFGTNEIALRLPSIIFSTIGILLTFLIGKYLFNKKTGYLAAFLYSIHGLIIELTAGRVPTDHIDVFFVFYAELAVLFAVKFVQSKRLTYNVLCGISIGAAILTKWMPALIVLPVWFLLVLDSKKFTFREIIIYFFVLCLTLTLVFLPWQLYIFRAFPLEARWESDFNFRHLTEALDNQGGPFYYHFDIMRMNFGELIYLPVLWLIWVTARKMRNFRRLVLFIWIFVPYLFFSFVKTKMQGYTIISAPAIFLLTAYFWYYLFKLKYKFRYKWITYSVLFLLIFLPIRYSIERVKPFQTLERNLQWAGELKNLNKQNYGNKVILFNTSHAIEAMFYNDIAAYPNIPEINLINKLIDEQYTILINDNDKLSGEIRKINKVHFVKLSD